MAVNTQIFECSLSDNIIKLSYDDTKCWIVSYTIDENYVQLFFILLKGAMESMKEKGIKIFEQLVSVDDWEEYLQSDEMLTLEKIDIYNRCVVTCNINYASICIAKGFGWTDG